MSSSTRTGVSGGRPHRGKARRSPKDSKILMFLMYTVNTMLYNELHRKCKNEHFVCVYVCIHRVINDL